MKVKIDYPTKDEEKVIIERMAISGNKPQIKPVMESKDILKAKEIIDQIYIDHQIIDYILNIIQATRHPASYKIKVEEFIDFGASPRATLAFVIGAKTYAFLQGRSFVTPHDIKTIGKDILRHRIQRSYEAEAENISTDQIIDMIFDAINAP